ncbi:family 78 glycoside hydrolase catalytic domain [Actinocrispum wychmicini]|uniref:family 78 glycoside hydrolase catalytic domain n=1 Tax=Actinocrispum wychmicini TaxID=1213861 RepID=UPI0010486F44|nr:family 78 glycoside hydrolase catalytic domain [Actinocrispum wychmicini]
MAAPRVDYLTDPTGIDDQHPKLSWEMSAAGRNQTQTGYQVQAATTADGLGSPDLWDSGRVASSVSVGVPYGGPALTSRQQVFWHVRVWDANGQVTGWSPVAHWEMGLLGQADWSAQWIASPASPVVVRFPAQNARWVRLNVTRLGLPLKEDAFANPVSRLQLAEMAVGDSASGRTDLALGKSVKVSESYVAPGQWAPEYVTDGRLTADQPPYGYTSREYTDPNHSAWVELDLGQQQRFDEVLLYPRTGITTADGYIPNFPVDYQIQYANGGPFSTAWTVTDQTTPSSLASAPQFAKQFNVGRPVRSARLYMTGVGVYDVSIDGQGVTSAVLQPPNTDFRKRVIYTTYDVTAQLGQGDHTIGVTLANGIADMAGNTGDRWKKFDDTMATPRLLAQLEITYADGGTARVNSDTSWRTAPGPTVFANWYGGEEYDARMAQSGWDKPNGPSNGWPTAVASAAPSPQTVLSAQMAPPVQPVGTLRPVSVTKRRDGDYVVDLGTNFAGWEQLSVSGPAGTRVTMRPGELLAADGSVDQRTFAYQWHVWDTYTLAGNGTEVWHPRFTYHGFRYLEVTGLAAPPDVTGIELSTANPQAGTFDSANQLVNSVHRIVHQAYQNNLFGVPTDTPAREKLGWVEQDHLVFDAISRDYDVAAYFRQFLRTVADSQLDSGLVPDITPEYTVFSGAFRDDPNWGSTLVLTAWQLYQTYGDRDTLAALYPQMRKYLSYLQNRAGGGSLLTDGDSLGDWFEVNSGATSGQLTINYAYHEVARTLAKISAVLGDNQSANSYNALAGSIGDAINRTFAHGDTYDRGSQAADALALDMGIVPDASRQAVFTHLVNGIAQARNHLTVGEIALTALIRVLSDGGRDDVLYDLLIQTASPSYGYQVTHGATSLTERWTGPDTPDSQDHLMLGAIEGWFSSGLGGVRTAPDAVAGDKLVIKPAVVGGLPHATSTFHTPHGPAVSDWNRSGTSFSLHVQVPVGSTATVQVPVDPANPVATAGYQSVQNGFAVYQVGSGGFDFTSTLPVTGSTTVRAANETLVMFTVRDGKLMGTNQQQTDGGFVPWYRLDGDAGVTGVPASALSPANGRTVQAFARTTDGNIKVFGQSSPTSAFSPGVVIGGGPTFAGDPAVTLAANGGMLVTAVDTTGNVWAARQTAPGTWFEPWTKLSAAGGFTGTPAAVLSPGVGGTLNVFARTTDGHIQVFGQSTPDSGFSAGAVVFGDGPTFAGDPAVGLAANGTMVVAAVDTGGNVQATNQPAVAQWFRTWYQVSLYGGLTGRPAVVKSPANNGTVQIVARTTGGQIGIFGQSTPTSGFSTGDVIATDGGPAASGEPALWLAANGTMIVAVESGGDIWATNQSSVASWFVNWYRI